MSVFSRTKLGKRGRQGGVRGKTGLTRQRSGGTNEVQTFTITGATTGSFKATLPGFGQTPGTIAFNDSAANVQAALRAIPGVGTDITCGGGPLNTAAVTITFSGKLAQTDIPTLTIQNSTVDGSGVAVATSTPGVTRYAMDEDKVSSFANGSNFNENIPFYQHPSRRGP